MDCSWSYVGPCSLLVCLLVACPSAPSSVDTDTAAPSTSSGESDSAGTTAAGTTSSGTTSDDEPTAPTSAGTTSTSDTSDTSGTTSTSGTTTGGVVTETTTGDGTTTEEPGVDTCGDGVLDPGELCDDGNVLAGDDCLPNCTPGTGTALPSIDLVFEGTPTCLTTIDGAVIGEAAHVLALGGWTWDTPVGALVQGVALPEGQPLPGSFVHPGGVFDRRIDAVATAADGDIVVAGHIDTDPQQLAGHLWLARLSPVGDVVWLREHETLLTDPEDLAVAGACLGGA